MSDAFLVPVLVLLASELCYGSAPVYRTLRTYCTGSYRLNPKTLGRTYCAQKRIRPQTAHFAPSPPFSPASALATSFPPPASLASSCRCAVSESVFGFRMLPSDWWGGSSGWDLRARHLSARCAMGGTPWRRRSPAHSSSRRRATSPCPHIA
jgi:hypothetical protein